MGQLTALTALDLHDNALTGEVPPQIGTLSNLRTLVLSKNLFSGELPNLGGLKSLEKLDFGGLYTGSNCLSGAFPSGIEQCMMLQELHLCLNAAEGELPLVLGSMREKATTRVRYDGSIEDGLDVYAIRGLGQ